MSAYYFGFYVVDDFILEGRGKDVAWFEPLREGIHNEHSFIVPVVVACW